jgi:hypothetical protein
MSYGAQAHLEKHGQTRRQADDLRGPTDSEDRLVALKCPHCGDEDLYRWNNRAEHPYQPKQ